MVKDFRNVGRLPEQSQPPETAPSAMPARNQRIILLAIRFTGIGFVVAGIWLLAGDQSLIDPKSAAIMGYAFTFAGIADIAVASFLKRLWSKNGRNPS